MCIRDRVHTLHENGMECVMEFYFAPGMNQNVILDALRFWVREYHVDGFHLQGDSLPVTAAAQDLLLSRTKLFYTHFDPILLENAKKYHHLYVYSDEYLYPARKMLNHMEGNLNEFFCQQRKQNSVEGFVNYITKDVYKRQTGMHVLHLVIRWQLVTHPVRICRKLWIHLLKE